MVLARGARWIGGYGEGAQQVSDAQQAAFTLARLLSTLAWVIAVTFRD